MLTRSLSIALAGAVLCGLASTARAETMTMDHGMVPALSKGARTPAGRAFAASSRAMMTSMAVKPTGDADRDFVAMMLPHHRGAVEMAKVELRYGRDPGMRRLATAIVQAQTIEIARMRAWQRMHVR